MELVVLQTVNSQYEALLQKYATLVDRAEMGVAAMEDGMSADSVEQLLNLVDASEVCMQWILSGLCFWSFVKMVIAVAETWDRVVKFEVCLFLRVFPLCEA